jgi:hypothetical protein
LNITGTVSVNGGTLSGIGGLTGTVIVGSGGHVAPGTSIGTLGAGGLTLQPGAILDFELDTLLGTNLSDMINVIQPGGLTLNGGTINLIGLGALGDGVYTLIDYDGTLNGSVNNLLLGTTPAGQLDFELVDSGSSIDLIVSSDLPGDFNGDGAVDMADFLVWRRGLGTVYFQSDYDLWVSNFGTTAGGGSGGGSLGAVPEPASLALLAMALLSFAFGRRSCPRG